MGSNGSEGGSPRHPEVTPIRGSFFESTVGAMVARVYSRELADDKLSRDDFWRIVGYVADANDALERMKRTGWSGVGDDSWSNRRARLVEYLRDGGLISDLFEDDDLCRIRVQMLWDDVIGNLCKRTRNTRPSRIVLMDQLDWVRLESAIDGGESIGRPLAREIGLSPSTVDRLHELYQQAGRGVPIRH